MYESMFKFYNIYFQKFAFFQNYKIVVAEPEEEFVPQRDAKGDERLEQGLRPVQERMQERCCGEHTQR